MKHRFTFLIALLLAPLAFSLAAETKRPNVLLVLYDDMSANQCSAYGGSSIQTPYFDKLAREGILFKNGYCSAPSCAPARAAILTGKNFWELEQGAFIQAWFPSKFVTLTERLSAAGYRTGYTGKGWGPGVREPGKPKRDPVGPVFNDILKKMEDQEECISPVDYAGNFQKFLDTGDTNAPFFFWAGIREPHRPNGKDNDVKLAKAGYPTEAMKVPPFLPDTLGIKKEIAKYEYASRDCDISLGKLLKVLEARGLAEDTIVIVTGDNGMDVPRAKAALWHWGLHVPYAIRWPARINTPGRTVDDMVNHIDYAPTILEAAGIPLPKEMTGKSLLPIFESPKSGQVDATREFTVGGLEWHGKQNAGRTILDQRFQYIVNYSTDTLYTFRPDLKVPLSDESYEQNAAKLDIHGFINGYAHRPEVAPYAAPIFGPRAAEELYDLDKDLGELNNLAEKPDYAAVKDRMRKALFSYLAATQDPRATGDMALFNETSAWVQSRKDSGYADTARKGAKAKHP